MKKKGFLTDDLYLKVRLFHTSILSLERTRRMVRFYVKFMYPIITREGLMNRGLTILWLWM